MRNSEPLLCFGFFLLLCLAPLSKSTAKPTDIEKGKLILVQLNVERKITFYIDAYLYQEQLYLPLTQMFSMLKVETSYTPGSEFSVFFPFSKDPVEFNFNDQTIEGPQGSFAFLKDDVFRTKDEVFVLKSLFEKLWDMEILFDYRKLRIIIFSDAKLPVIEFHERKQRYASFASPSAKPSPDVKMPPKHYLLNGWAADWSLNSSHNLNGYSYSYNVGLGGHFLGGNFTVRGSGSKQYGLHWQRIKGRWTYPVYSSPFIKKIQVGYLSHESSIGLNFHSFRGIKITNNPNAPRQYFNTFYYNGFLNEGWDSELYVNRQLRDFVIGDERRPFQFSAPLQYGSNFIQLKYYDPNGFHHQKQYLIYIPQEFLPPGKFQYTLSAGRLATVPSAEFGRFNLKMGISPSITMGAGSVIEMGNRGRQVLPFVQSWIRLGSHAIFKGSHLFNRMTESALRVTFSGSQSILVNVKKYYQSTDFNNIGKSLEASLNTSFPVHFSFLNFSTFLSSRYASFYSGSQSLYVFGGISGRLPLGFNLHLNNRVMFSNENIKNILPTQFDTEVYLTKRMFRNLLLMPKLRFNHRLDKVTDVGVKMKLRISPRFHIDFSFHRNLARDNNQFLFSFKWDLPFARHTSFFRSNSGIAAYNQYTSGSVIFSGLQPAFYFDNRKRTEKASLIINPFLDVNNNGKKDANEPSVDRLTVDVFRQGQNEPSYRDQKVIENLVPFERYIIKVNDATLGNPLWKAKHASYSIQVLPNMFNIVSIPVIATGEVSGKVTIDNPAFSASLNGLDVKISSVRGNFSTELTTYLGGSFYYVGLKPGTYKAILNSKQLARRSLVAVKDSVQFIIEPAKRGDIVDGLSFKVTSLNDAQYQPLKELFAIQIGAFREKKNAISFVKTSELKTDHNVTVIFNTEQKLFKCRLGFFKSRKEAEQQLKKLIAKQTELYNDAFIVRVSLDQSFEE